MSSIGNIGEDSSPITNPLNNAQGVDGYLEDLYRNIERQQLSQPCTC